MKTLKVVAPICCYFCEVRNPFFDKSSKAMDSRLRGNDKTENYLIGATSFYKHFIFENIQ